MFIKEMLKEGLQPFGHPTKLSIRGSCGAAEFRNTVSITGVLGFIKDADALLEAVGWERNYSTPCAGERG